MATPKLALIPTGYKAGKLYSVLPESGVGDFTVVRATEATRVNEAGLIETMGANVPRLDYSGGGCPVLLTESQSTNLFAYSEDFSNSYWSKTSQGSAAAPIVTDNYAISPDGTQNATRVQFDAVGNTDADRSGLVRNFSFTTGQTYSISCWVKSTNGTSQVIQFRIAGVQVSEEQIATSEWKLYTATFTSTATTTDNFGMQIRGTNSVNESDILIYGMQLELSDYATSYIKTEGSAVTRNGDQVYGAGDAATFNDSEGVLMLEASGLANDGTYRNICLSDGSLINRILIQYTPTANQINIVIIYSGGQYSLSHTVSNITDFSKFLIKYKINDLALWVNGFEVDTDTSAFLPSGLNTLSFDNTIGDAFYGNTSQIQYFNTALNDSDLETLTSWTSFIEMAQAQNYNII